MLPPYPRDCYYYDYYDYYYYYYYYDHYYYYYYYDYYDDKRARPPLGVQVN